MTDDALRRWVLATLEANSGVRAALGSPLRVEAAGDDLPTSTGLYYEVVEGRRLERWADEVPFRVIVYCDDGELASSVSRAADVARAVEAALAMNAGEPRGFDVEPTEHNLRVWAITRTTYLAGTPVGKGGVIGTAAMSVFAYRVRGAYVGP